MQLDSVVLLIGFIKMGVNMKFIDGNRLTRVVITEPADRFPT